MLTANERESFNESMDTLRVLHAKLTPYNNMANLYKRMAINQTMEFLDVQTWMRLNMTCLSLRYFKFVHK